MVRLIGAFEFCFGAGACTMRGHLEHTLVFVRRDLGVGDAHWGRHTDIDASEPHLESRKSLELKRRA